MIRALMKSIFCLLLIANISYATDFIDLDIGAPIQTSIEEQQKSYGGKETSGLMPPSSPHNEIDKSCNYDLGFCCGRFTCFFTTPMGENHDSCSYQCLCNCLNSGQGSPAGALIRELATGLTIFVLAPFYVVGASVNACAECDGNVAFEEGYERGIKCYPGDCCSCSHVCGKDSHNLSDQEFEEQLEAKKQKAKLEKELEEAEDKRDAAKYNKKTTQQQYNHINNEYPKLESYQNKIFQHEQEFNTHVSEVERIQSEINKLNEKLK